MNYLFFDIDGTILNSKHQPDLKSVEAIHEAMAKGNHAFFCTGRSYKMCDELSVFDIHNAIIANGAAVIINNKPVITHPIDKEIVNHTIELVNKYDGGIQILDVDYGYQNKKTHDFFAYNFTQYETDPVDKVFERRCMKTMDKYKGTPILKIDVFFNTIEIMKKFREEIDSSLQYIPAGGYTKEDGDRSGELILKSVSKGTGIEELINYVQGNMNNTYGFGDSENDIGMLKAVAHPVMVKPGTESLTKLAEYITESPDHGGVALALKHYNIID